MSFGASEFRAVFLGAPGAGKGTQALELVAEHEVLHISTGDMLRQHRKDGTDLGLEAQGFMDKGNLVPDDLIIKMVEERLLQSDANRSWILDGFPRTLPQAEALGSSLASSGSALSHVVFFGVPNDVLVSRLSGRSTCASCGAIWNAAFKPPAQEGVCDNCKGKLLQRPDDMPEAVQKRLEVYSSQTEPLLGFYRSLGILTELDANRAPDVVYDNLVKALSTR